MIGIGFFPMFEVVGRLTEVAPFDNSRADLGYQIRDLSFNAKFQLPYKHDYLPNIALGIQDKGGASTHYANTYLVLDKEIGPLRTSLGYGISGNENITTARMDGLFGGVEMRVTPWCYLLAEHDGVENHAAVRLSMPQQYSNSFNLEATIAQNLTNSQTSVALNLYLPLFHKSKIDTLHYRRETTSSQHLEPLTPDSLSQPSSTEVKSSDRENDYLLTLQKRLVDIGFENVMVGYYDTHIYIRCENSIFDHTDIDALGYIAGTIAQSSQNNLKYSVTLLKNNLQTLTMSGDSQIFKEYLTLPNGANLKALRDNLEFARTFDESKVRFVTSRQNSSFWRPTLELSPGLTTTIGTEVGLFDYLVSLRANLYTTVYDGLTLSAMYETPLIHSNNFDDGKTYAFLYQDRLKSRLVNAQLHQTLHYNSLLSTTSIGQFRTHNYGILNQTNFTTTSGEHGVNLRLGVFTDKDNSSSRRKLYLASYRYLYAPMDLFGEVTYGQYWNQDRGITLQLKRFFGETSVALYYKDTTKSYLGFTVSLPLTKRKSSYIKRGAIKGKKDFNYGIRTVVRDNHNNLTPSGAIIPKTDLDLVTHYLDRDRLNASYIKAHLDRMREAYLLYSKH